jgi:hypothetical protein
MKLELKKHEIVHIICQNLKVFSSFRTITFMKGDKFWHIKAPLTLFDLLSLNIRILKRFFRTDKCNVFLLNKEKDEYLLIRQGKVYLVEKRKLTFLFRLKLCRNLMHIDLCRTPNGNLYFGEYGANLKRTRVPIYGSVDGGKSWNIVYWFKENTIKHIHCMKYDPYSNKIWTFTGDNEGECVILISDEHFITNNTLGDGTQKYRACNVFFEKDKVVWMMDSPNEVASCVHYNRKTKEVTKVYDFIGPVWYSHELDNGYYICASSVEPGYSMEKQIAQVLVSKDLINWQVKVELKKDMWPIKYFKYGVVAFPIGKQQIRNVYMFGEALNDLEGIVKIYDLSK